MPLPVRDAPALAAMSSRDANTQKTLPMVALIVDDDPVTRSILRRILDSAGFAVLEADDGREALECLQRTDTINLALVDWNMPNISGCEFVRAIRATPAYSHLPLMVVTTESEIEQIAEALAAGADEYVMKPVTRDTVLEKLQLLGITSDEPWPPKSVS